MKRKAQISTSIVMMGILELISYLTQSTPIIHYKDQTVNVTVGNYFFSL
jgi:hypothetical protein